MPRCLKIIDRLASTTRTYMPSKKQDDHSSVKRQLVVSQLLVSSAGLVTFENSAIKVFRLLHKSVYLDILKPKDKIYIVDNTAPLNTNPIYGGSLKS